MEQIELLNSFGLTRQEALIYLTLLTEGNQTGYEAAKQSGVSRSNAYSALAGLVDKGAAYIIEGTATRYIPVPVDEFCDNKISRMKQYKQELIKLIPAEKKDSEAYMTIQGRMHISDKAKRMINEAAQRIYLAADRYILEQFYRELKAALARGIKVVLISDTQGLDGAQNYQVKKKDGQLRLITDSRYVLTGDFQDEHSTCLYSGKKNLADVFKEALSNEIRLIELTKGDKHQ